MSQETTKSHYSSIEIGRAALHIALTANRT